MTIYFLTILLLFSFALLDAKFTIKLNTNRLMLSITYFLLVTQIGLRWQTGTDWVPYLNHFNSISDFASASPLKNGFEYGYNILVLLIKFIFSDYSFFLVVHAIVYYFLIFISFKRYNPYFYLTLLMFYALTMGMMGSNRQLIAIAICIYAVRFIIEKRPILFFLLIVIAITFHTTAFIFAVYYFLNRDIRPRTFFIVLISSFIIGKSQLPFFIFSFIGDLSGGHIATKIIFYVADAKYSLVEHKLTIIGLFKRLILLSIFYYNRKIISERLPYYNTLLNGYILGIAIYFLFADSLLILVNRGSLYFNIMEPMLIASQVAILKGKENKSIAVIILFVISIFFFFQSIATYSNLFIPYKGIFINTDYYRIMY